MQLGHNKKYLQSNAKRTCQDRIGVSLNLSAGLGGSIGGGLLGLDGLSMARSNSLLIEIS
jgi:hypothetical protein